MVIFFDRLKFSLGEAGVFIATWISLIVIERSSPIERFVQVLPWIGLIVIEHSSPIEQFRSGFALNRPDCNWARKSY